MKTVRIGIAGLGRLGYEHAKNIATAVPGAELRAICDVDSARVRTVAEEFGVQYTYSDFAEMCANPELDAVVIVSPSMYHADQISTALGAGKHVFCEKPLDVNVERCRVAAQAVEAHPGQIFMLGFMRRFDHSYQLAKKKIENGDIGKIILVRSYTQDPRSTIESTLRFAPHSGGQFLDMMVHDIDLVRWFTKSEPKRVWGLGGVFEFPIYRELHDGDNVCAMMQCENEAMAFMFAGRTAAHGTNVETEIIGTRGTLRIGAVGTDSMLEVLNEHGVCRECYQDFMRRWHEAYVSEMTEFAACIRENRKPEVTVYDGTACSKIAYACKESFETGRQIDLG